jgi:hypothetical protein
MTGVAIVIPMLNEAGGTAAGIALARRIINHLLRHLVTVGDQPAHPAYQQLGDTNVSSSAPSNGFASKGAPDQKFGMLT